jgi:hypothetical protein
MAAVSEFSKSFFAMFESTKQVRNKSKDFDTELEL